MSLKDVAYQLAKEVKKNPHRDELKKIISSLNGSPSGEEKINRGEYGQQARRLGIQLLGYLLLDQQRDRIAISLPEMEQRERELIGSFHRELVDLNRQCVNGLLQTVGIPWEAIDPYNQYAYSMPDKSNGVQFLPTQQTDLVVSEFSLHKAIGNIVKATPSRISIPDPADYTQSILNLVGTIEANGVHDAPRDLVRVALQMPKSSPDYIAMRHFALVASIRASLNILNQILFQAITSDQLAMINEDNLIKVIKHNSNTIGTGVSVKYIMDEKLIFALPRDVILFFLSEDLGFKNVELGYVYSTQISFSSDQGNTGEISFRQIDNDLNPYPHLIRE